MTPAPRYDLRDQRASAKVRVRGGRVVVRDPATITGVVVHQMAAPFGVSTRQLRLAGGVRELALARRALGIACHGAAFLPQSPGQPGPIVLSAPCTWYVNHGNGLNATTIGYEIDGRHPGVDDDPDTAPLREDIRSTWGGPPSEIGTVGIATAREGLRWLVETARAEGCPIEWVYAHRQSSATRRSDPGERLWRAVVLEWAVPRLGLRTAPADTWGDGRPVPLAWDPAGVGAY
jgi:hypothetical protein